MKKKSLKRDEFLKIHCIVYRYWPKNPEEEDKDKSYVGTTPDEETRKSCWNKKNDRYAGKKLQEARQKYDPKSGWNYEVLEEAFFDNDEDARNWMNQKEEFYIAKFNSRDNGFNSSKGGTGNKGGLSEQHRANIKKNHSHYSPTQEQREHLSKKLKGRERSPEECAKIKAALTGKPKTDAHKQAMSACRKGVVPKAASDGAALWRETHDPWWSNHEITEEMRANMKVAQQLRGTKVKATSPDGDVKAFPTLLDAAKWVQSTTGNSKIGAAHISHYIKSGKIIDGIGYKFEKITVDEYKKLAS